VKLQWKRKIKEKKKERKRNGSFFRETNGTGHLAL
jgi:hypothetical protein